MGDEYRRAMDEKMMFHFMMACQFTKCAPFTPEQMAANRLIAASPAATRAFLGTYNRAVGPEEFESIMEKLAAEAKAI